MATKVLLLICLGGGVWSQNCNPGPCSRIPGLVYNADLDQCAWPDEIGCSLNDLGYNTDCGSLNPFELKAVDFEVLGIPSDRTSDQYFLVCVPETTEDDRVSDRAYSTGPPVPRLLGCPRGHTFNPNTKVCEEL
eukprot:maker-scaffold241_size241811-snap-gene-1.14 protein:Tk11760 transcript:maker-scaffold241_size241811-snap-gene-1.14-mRNA-1 annotation:"chitin binding peritrophin-"